MYESMKISGVGASLAADCVRMVRGSMQSLIKLNTD